MIKVIKSVDKMVIVCRKILSKLPAYFPYTEPSENYIKNTKDITMIVKEDINGNPLGFLTINPKNKNTAEIHVMGVDPNYQRQGVGSSLINKAKYLATLNGFTFLLVKVINNNLFKAARNFYEKNEFRSIELTTKTGEDDFRLTMVMVLSKEKLKPEDKKSDIIC